MPCVYVSPECEACDGEITGRSYLVILGYENSPYHFVCHKCRERFNYMYVERGSTILVAREDG